MISYVRHLGGVAKDIILHLHMVLRLDEGRSGWWERLRYALFRHLEIPISLVFFQPGNNLCFLFCISLWSLLALRERKRSSRDGFFSVMNGCQEWPSGNEGVCFEMNMTNLYIHGCSVRFVTSCTCVHISTSVLHSCLNSLCVFLCNHFSTRCLITHSDTQGLD